MVIPCIPEIIQHLPATARFNQDLCMSPHRGKSRLVKKIRSQTLGYEACTFGLFGGGFINIIYIYMC